MTVKPVLRVLRSVLIALACTAAAAGVRWLLTPLLGQSAPYVTYFPAVLGAALLGGTTAGVLTLALGTAITTPLYLGDLGREEIARVISFLVSAGLLIAMAAWLNRTLARRAAAETRLREAEAQLRTHIGELGHRARNGLMVVMAIIDQSARGQTEVRAFHDLIRSRLSSMAKAQGLVSGSKGGGARLRDLLPLILDHFDWTRFDLFAGPDVTVEGEVSTGLALLLNELATNAVKYGALSVPGGKVVLRWTLTGETALLEWREVGGPPPAIEGRTGFGSQLIDVVLKPQGGGATRRFEPTGAVVEIRMPAQLAEPAV